MQFFIFAWSFFKIVLICVFTLIVLCNSSFALQGCDAESTLFVHFKIWLINNISPHICLKYASENGDRNEAIMHLLEENRLGKFQFMEYERCCASPFIYLLGDNLRVDFYLFKTRKSWNNNQNTGSAFKFRQFWIRKERWTCFPLFQLPSSHSFQVFKLKKKSLPAWRMQ
jgi:hypothetical protein